MTAWTGFCPPLLNVYFNLYKSTGGCIYEGEFPFEENYSDNDRPEKCPFIGILLAVRWSVKYFFAPNSLLFRKSSGEKKEKGNYEAWKMRVRR